MKKQSLQQLVNKIEKASASLRHDNGLYSASAGEHYVSYTWCRDLFMQTLDIPKKDYLQSWTTFLDFAVKCENKYNKFSTIIKEGKSAEPFHIRWCAKTNDEIEPEWGMMQMDAWGMMLMAIAKEGDTLLQNPEYKNVVKLMLQALNSYEYWNSEDCGAWEENHEHRQSSIACAASGVYDIAPYYPELSEMTDKMIEESKWIIEDFGTNETPTRSADLAQLHGVWFGVPRKVMSLKQGKKIIRNIEKNLLRRNGVARYKRDEFYNINLRLTLDKYNGVFNPQAEGKIMGGEAEWVFGFPTLTLARKSCGMEVPEYYIKRMKDIALHNNGVIPELYYAKTNICNDNRPLGWSCNLFRIVMTEYLEFGKINSLA